MAQQISHEKLDQKSDVKSGSDKSFGLVFSVVFALIGLWPLMTSQPIRLWAIGISFILILVAFAMPKILKPLNRLWFLFGLLLHKIVSPVIMALIFYTTVTPIGLIMRVLGKCPIPLSFDPDASSYWIERDPPGPEPKTMPRQF